MQYTWDIESAPALAEVEVADTAEEGRTGSEAAVELVGTGASADKALTPAPGSADMAIAARCFGVRFERKARVEADRAVAEPRAGLEVRWGIRRGSATAGGRVVALGIVGDTAAEMEVDCTGLVVEEVVVVAVEAGSCRVREVLPSGLSMSMSVVAGAFEAVVDVAVVHMNHSGRC